MSLWDHFDEIIAKSGIYIYYLYNCYRILNARFFKTKSTSGQGCCAIICKFVVLAYTTLI
jgi:hypothetical protein